MRGSTGPPRTWRRHFLIVDGDFLASIGIDPADPDLGRMGRDWARPADARARARLFGQVVMHRARPVS